MTPIYFAPRNPPTSNERDPFSRTESLKLPFQMIGGFLALGAIFAIFESKIEYLCSKDFKAKVLENEEEAVKSLLLFFAASIIISINLVFIGIKGGENFACYLVHKLENSDRVPIETQNENEV